MILIVALVFASLASPVPSLGQQSGKVYRIGVLGAAKVPAERTPQGCPIQFTGNWQAVMKGIQKRGYVPGQNLIMECRYTEGREDRAPALAAELVRLKADLLIAIGTIQVRAAKLATTETPILMLGVIDPVRRGLVASLAHPGGNVTGQTDTAGGVQIERKRMQLLKEAVPTASRVAILSIRHETPEAVFGAEWRAAAQALGVTLQYYEVREPEELKGAFTAMITNGAEALLVASGIYSLAQERSIVAATAQSRLPAMYENREFVDAGGLMSYEANLFDLRRRVGFYVDKIFKGAKPSDLPVEQPIRFDLVINLKTVKALGLTIPQSLLSRADEVIQ